MINASGFKVWREVEEGLFRHQRVAMAAVIGERDSYRGETVKAVVVLGSGRLRRLRGGFTTATDRVLSREALLIQSGPHRGVSGSTPDMRSW